MTYRVIVVGTDGSDTSMRAVQRAATLAAEADARLIVASAYTPTARGGGAPDPDQPRDENYRTAGDAPVFDLLRDAAAKARSAGAKNVEERALAGTPADALIALAEEVQADLLVVGDVGFKSMLGRLVGSVPRIVSKNSTTEVLVVETSK